MFNDFEGFKRIKNTVNLTIEGIYDVLSSYQSEMGEMKYVSNLGVRTILVKLEGKYDATIRIHGKQIIIERILEEGMTKDALPTEENGKNIEMAQADRMIDQIAELLQDFIKNGKVKEHITSAKLVMKMIQSEKKILGGLLTAGTTFDFTDIRNNKLLYQAIEKPINKEYAIKSIESKMEVVSVNYEKLINNNIISIQEKPFRITEMKLDTTSVKTNFISLGNDREIEISADYTDNHYVIELSKIVIGSIDCLDSQIKKEYRVEVNDIKNINLVVASAVLLDEYFETINSNKK